MIDDLDQKRRVIWISFVVSTIFQVMPWPDTIRIFRPNWVFLTLLYWLFTTAHSISISTSFMIGVVLDLVTASTLGTHALAMSIISYLVMSKYWFFRNLSLLQQALIVVALSIVMDYVVFLARLFVMNISFQPKVYWRDLINGLLWPWFFLMMGKIQQKFSSKKRRR